jgi:hypothetical protein
MGTQVTDIRQAIQSLSGMNDLQYEGVTCIVSAIDLVAFTCTCTPINGDAEFFDVLLNADADKGFTLIPKDGSVVIVQQTSQATAYVSMVSKVDQVYLAGDINGGLVKVIPLVAKINAIETQLNAIGTWALTVTPPLTLPPLTPTTTNEISNNTVKHGNG